MRSGFVPRPWGLGGYKVDLANRATEGLLGMQLHVGGPFEIDFRNIYLKPL